MAFKKEDLLDEKGFVFLDSASRPYWCCMYHGEPWFMYWHECQKSWVTLRKCSGSEVMLANQKALPEDQANLYHKLHKEFEDRMFGNLNKTNP